MDKLSALIQNFNTDCYKQYTKVSSYLGSLLDDSLKEIEKFYYSEFWERRFKRRIREERLQIPPFELCFLQGLTTELRENTRFKLYDESQNSSGVSNNDTMIALNINMKDLNDSHINNIIMHEFGHRQYNQPEFNTIVKLNKRIIGQPGLYIKNNETLAKEDYLYFTDDNELRQRIIPIIKEMYDNKWTAEEAYKLSENLKKDDIRDIFTKDYIIDLLNNIL